MDNNSLDVTLDIILERRNSNMVICAQTILEYVYIWSRVAQSVVYERIRNMSHKLLGVLLIVQLTLPCTQCSYIYSSFWAPLFDRRILNYRVDAPFHPDSGSTAREQYAKDYGYRGEKLIADLGNGVGPGDYSKDYKAHYGDVKFYYT
ncbi:uncharacterized protein LOC142983188 [Anticarsia gemmatalis]|uniref:uncharacterized protein LOC142983188 n=1 Tax=Anticarsia gemmatalis TaxID=129554 RepID=UPI003F75A8BB